MIGKMIQEIEDSSDDKEKRAEMSVSSCHDVAKLEPMTLCYMARALDHYTIYYNT